VVEEGEKLFTGEEEVLNLARGFDHWRIPRWSVGDGKLYVRSKEVERGRHIIGDLPAKGQRADGIRARSPRKFNPVHPSREPTVPRMTFRDIPVYRRFQEAV